MKIALETHAYAPELNRAYLGPNMVRVNANGVTLVSEYRKRNKAVPIFIQATVTTLYDDPAKKWLQRTYSGKVETRADALVFAQDLRTKLADGGRVIVKTKLVGG